MVFLIRLALIGISLSTSVTARADWVNLTGAETSPNIAEIYILDDRINLVLEIYIGNLEIVKELIPDSLFKKKDANRASLEQRLHNFSMNKFQFVTETGENLSARLVQVEPRMRKDRQSLFAGKINPYTRQRIPEAPSDKRVLYVELSYPFEEKPKQLTIIPPLDEQGKALATFGFITYHKAVPVIDFRYLGAPSHLTLDWQDPWYSKFDNRNLNRHHKYALMTYLYIEPYEVRHEVLTRVRDLEAWMDLGLRGDEFIEVDELNDLRQRIGEFFLDSNPVTIDGQLARPILDRTNYVQLSLSGIQLLERPERLEISTATVGVIISYITTGMPQEVSVDWQLFTDQVQRVPTSATDPAGPFISHITPDDNVFSWTNYLKNYKLPTVTAVKVEDTIGGLELPVGSIVAVLLILIMIGWGWRRRRVKKTMNLQFVLILGLLGLAIISYPYLRLGVSRPLYLAGELSSQQTTELLQVLLKNVYRAFDYREENDVYDKLVLSVEGELLETIYLQNRQSFAVQKAGGAQAKIQSVDIQSARASRLTDYPLGYAIQAKWSALGTVGHWGHLHQRKNQYDAIINVRAMDGVWKITDMEILQEQRVSPTSSVTTAPAQ